MSITVLRASAGSGKTYELTKRFLHLILSRQGNTNLKNIVAITFSNNAALEMKERILTWLKELSLGISHDRLEEVSGLTGIPVEELPLRAEETLEMILENYSDFQVKTIDSFMTSLFRATSLDFGLTEDFEILMDHTRLFHFAFERMLNEVEEGAPITETIEEVINEIISNAPGDRAYPWDPTDALLTEIKRIYQKFATRGAIPDFTDRRQEVQELREEIISKGREILRLLDSESLSPGRSTEKFRRAIQNGNPSDLLSLKGTPFNKGGSDPVVYQQALKIWSDIRQTISRYAYQLSHTYYRPYMEVFKRLNQGLEEVKRSHGKVFIEDINFYLSRYITSEVVPDIYFYIGERIYHWLIDEFQDTSRVQWLNLRPLVENSLSTGGSLFVVGDTKQSIYGFRDADYRIMKALEEGREFNQFRPAVKDLQINYRSRREVVKFSRDIFRSLDREEYLEAASLSGLNRFDQVSRQESPEGYVEVTESGSEENEQREALIKIIEDLRERGYRYSDISVLAYKNEDVLQVSTWLNEEGIPFVSYSSLDIRKRKLTAEIIALLRFLDSPINDLAFCTFMLGDVFSRRLSGSGPGRPQIRDFLFSNRDRRPLYKVFQESYPEIWREYFEDLFRLTGYLPLYDLVVGIYHKWDLFHCFPDEEATLARFLEVVKELETRGVLNLKDLLMYFEEPQDEALWTITVPEGRDAIRVMTIHKAKGLGFPVVVLFLKNAGGRRGFPHIWKEDGDRTHLLKITKDLCNHNDELESLYRLERINSIVNDLNTLYVGLTRAEEEMYILLSNRGKDSFPLDLLPKGYKSGRRGRGRGGLQRPDLSVQGPNPVLDTNLTLHIYETEDRRIRYYERRRGEAFHRLLEGIEYLDEETEETFMAKGLAQGLTEREVQDLWRFLRSEDVYTYFCQQDGREVFREREYVDSSGNLYRMDRVVVDPEVVTVIDYKTGTHAETDLTVDSQTPDDIKGQRPLDAYKRQMERYIQILRDVYPGRTIRGVLLFLDTQELYRIGPGD